MFLLSRAPIIDINPDDNKEYEYNLEFVSALDAKEGLYLYKFKRSEYPCSDPNNRYKVIGFSDLELLVELYERLDDFEHILEKPGLYWSYYWHKYNHDRPMTIYCKFDKKDRLKYNINKTKPRAYEPFNKVVKMHDVNDGPELGFPNPTSNINDEFGLGWGPIFEINVWVPRGKTVGEALTDDIRHWISEYINNTFEGDDNDEQDNR